MRHRLLPVTVLAALAVLTVALWLAVFARSSSTPDASSGGSGNGPADVVTATPGQDTPSASRSPSPSEGTEPSPSPRESASGSTGASDTPSATPTPSPTASSDATPPDGAPAIATTRTRFTAAPYETVALRGAVEGVDPGTALRVQYLRGERWRSFPWPVATGAGGRFTAYVELAAPGTHQLRVLEPGSGATSPTVTLQVA